MRCGCEGNQLCLAHKLAYWRDNGTLQVSPVATPNRRNQVAPKPSDGANAWERGTPVDARGMPQLGPDLKPIGNKKYAELRSKIEERKRRSHQAPLRSNP